MFCSAAMDIIHFVTLVVILIVPVVSASFGYLGPYSAGIQSHGYLLPRTLYSGYQPFFSYPFYNGIDNSLPLQVPAIATSRLIYSASTYRGFSYQSNFGDGGRSDVVFITGPNSQKLMLDSIESLQNQVAEFARGLPVPQSSNLTNSSLPASPEPQQPASTAKPQTVANPTTHTTASTYHFQIHPGSLSTSFGIPIPFSSIVSYHLATPEVQHSERVGEAEESMVSEIGVPPPASSSEQESVSVNILPRIESNILESGISEPKVSTNNPASEGSDARESAATTEESTNDSSSAAPTTATPAEVAETSPSSSSQDITTEEEQTTTTERLQETTIAASAETTASS